MMKIILSSILNSIQTISVVTLTLLDIQENILNFFILPIQDDATLAVRCLEAFHPGCQRREGNLHVQLLFKDIHKECY